MSILDHPLVADVGSMTQAGMGGIDLSYMNMAAFAFKASNQRQSIYLEAQHYLRLLEDPCIVFWSTTDLSSHENFRIIPHKRLVHITKVILVYCCLSRALFHS